MHVHMPMHIHIHRADWEYQPSESNQTLLKENLPLHFASWQQGKEDKQLHPVFMVLSGPGTGKSRLLDEMPVLCCEAVPTDAAGLGNALRRAKVFKVSFENGTPVDVSAEGKDAGLLIGTRMMWQLVRTPELQWDEFWSRKQFRISDALCELERISGTPRRQQSVMLLVDGLNRLGHTLGAKDTLFASALAQLAGLTNAGPEFAVVAAAATVHTPVDDLLGDSPQLRPMLEPPMLDGALLFPETDSALRVLIGDMGGHGRALEALQDAVKEAGSDASFAALTHTLRAKLHVKYSQWFKESAAKLTPLFEAVLARRRFTAMSELITDGFTVENATSLGLVFWRNHVLEVPYVLFWLLASSTAAEKDPIMSWLSENHPLTEEDRIEGRASVGLETHERWEEFVARFRALKSGVFEGECVPLGQLHAGAVLSQAAKKTTVVVRRQKLVQASRHYDSRSSGQDVRIVHENGTGELLDMVVRNAKQAPAADVFTAVELAQSSDGQQRTIVHETYACRMRDEVLSKVDFVEELNKAAAQDDIFMFFARGNSAPDLQAFVLSTDRRVGLVSHEVMLPYFGPFALRALAILNFTERPDINKATRRELESVKGIGQMKADTIIENRPYDCLGTAVTKTGLSRNCLSRLRFDEVQS
jgi:hypothetical protein